MTEYFNGFETGSLKNDAVFLTASISLSSPRTGNFCGLTNPTGTGRGYIAPGVADVPITFTNSTGSACRVAFRVNTRPASGTEEIMHWQGSQIRIDNTGILSAWSGFPTPTLQRTGTTVISTGAWYIAEVFMTTTAWKFRVYPHGSNPGADEFTYTDTIGNTQYVFGKATDWNGNTVSYSWDDIRIKDGVTNYLGDGRVVLIYPIQNPPTYDGFTKNGGGGLNISDVWDNTPVNFSLYARATGAPTKQTSYHNNIWPLSAPVTINAVQTTVFGNDNASGNSMSGMHIVGGTEYSTPINLGIGSGLNYRASYIWPSIPSIHDLNGSQVGVYRTDTGSSTSTVYGCWLEIDFSGPLPYEGGAANPVLFVIM
jgi:hypothetical protein